MVPSLLACFFLFFPPRLFLFLAFVSVVRVGLVFVVAISPLYNVIYGGRVASLRNLARSLGGEEAEESDTKKGKCQKSVKG